MSVDIHNPIRRKLPAWLVIACTGGIVLGVSGLVFEFARSPRDGWMWLIVNFVVYWGAASGIFTWAAVFRVAQAGWTPVINRFAHSAFAFMPALVLLLTALLIGHQAYMPWVAEPVESKEAWLNSTSLVIRQVAAALLFWIPGWLLVRRSLAADAATDVTDRDHHRLNVLAVVVVAAYAVTATIIAWDFMMSLSPMWTSTVFSVYYFTTSLQMGLCALIIMSAGLRKPLEVEDRLKPAQLRDLGNLLLAFSLFNMGLFFAQYLTIWYENLPEETPFLIVRYLRGTWPPMGWASFVVGYAIPFLLLQSRTIKLAPGLLCAVAIICEIGIGLERYVLVAPSMKPDLTVSFAGALSLLAFFALLLLCRMKFLAVYSPISRADEVLPR